MSLHLYPKEHYPAERIQDAYLIIHPKILERYDISREEFYWVFERASNFSQLKYPIEDENGIIYYDSEWYYMAQRFDDIEIKRQISEASKIKWKSKKTAYKYKDIMNHDDSDRIHFMRNAIKEKHDRSKWRQDILLNTGSREIIEFTYWGDNFFWISHDTRQGRNILGKLLMEYRDDLISKL